MKRMNNYEHLEALEAYDEELRKEILLLSIAVGLNGEKREELLFELNKIAKDLLKGKKKHPTRRLAGYKGYLIRLVREVTKE